ncbi:MAG: hypothetical protein GQ535_13395 [Rhodobacteraceae bacterium]|nr:hypothetical protein [Paracoccaceae bacterium]
MPLAASQTPDYPPVFRGLSLVAGHPALDLVNTVKYRGADRPQDKLKSFSDLIDWALTAGIISTADSTGLSDAQNGPALLGKIRVLRESLWCLFNADQTDKKRYAQALNTIEKAISSLRYKVKIDPQTGTLRQHITVRTPNDLIARIVDSIADLLTRRESYLIKTCDGCDCDWLFVDRTKARRRRWCDTRTCGNLARSRNFRNKQKQSH